MVGVILAGIWKMAYLWLPVTILMIGAGIYESRHPERREK